MNRPGWKTTEAWFTGVVGWLMHNVLNSSDDWKVKAAAALGAAGVASVYIWSRTKVKTGE
tara:strand:- start:523 stop:702 length:180 start_codon:yes stop_codon:yes gene_type:complete